MITNTSTSTTIPVTAPITTGTSSADILHGPIPEASLIDAEDVLFLCGVKKQFIKIVKLLLSFIDC